MNAKEVVLGALLASSSGGGSDEVQWGSISGNINNQTDVINKISEATLNNIVDGTNGSVKANDTASHNIYGNYNFVEGEAQRIINAHYSHAEGAFNTITGSWSHAENGYNTIGGNYSHAEGYGNNANRSYQHIEGMYATIDDGGSSYNTKGNYIHIAGNGADASNRSNAYTLDWSGNGVYAGKLTVGANPTNSMDVVTKGYLESYITSLDGNGVEY